jgi:hypothetical protein
VVLKLCQTTNCTTLTKTSNRFKTEKTSSHFSSLSREYLAESKISMGFPKNMKLQYFGHSIFIKLHIIVYKFALIPGRYHRETNQKQM